MSASSVQTHYIIRQSLTIPNVWEIVSEITPLQLNNIVTPTAPPTMLIHPPLQFQSNNTVLATVPSTFESMEVEQAGSGNELQQQDDFTEVPISSAFSNTLQYSVFRPSTPKPDLLRFLKLLAHHLKNKVLNLLNEYGGLKIWTSTEIEYAKPGSDGEPIVKYLHTKAQTVYNDFELDQLVKHIINQTVERNANYIQDRSGLVVHKVNSTALHIATHAPLDAASGWSELPKAIRDKHAVVNIHNKEGDNRCFGYAILSMLHPHSDNPHRATNYDRFFHTLNLHQLNYPIEPSNVPVIEDIIRIAISIYGCSDDGLYKFPIYVSKKQFPKRIDLLYWKEHFAWIKDFPALFFDVSKYEHKKFFCHNCLGHFVSQNALDNHNRNCQMAGFMSTIYTMPHEGTILKFKNVRHEQKLVFKIFADFEALIAPPGDNPNNRAHTPCGAGFKVVSLLPGMQIPYQSFRGANCVDWFLDTLVEIEQRLLHYLFEERPLIWDTDQEAQDRHAVAPNCYLCGGEFGADESTRKVRDHDHLTGIYRGAAHSKCNLLLQKTYKIPVFFHNFRGYDSHILVHSLPRFPDRKVNIIAQSMEKYLILNWGDHIVFKDSYQFLNVSLDRLTANLYKAGANNFLLLKNEFAGNDNVDLLLRKGIYPYDYMDTFDRFEERELPPIENFYNALTDENLSDADYARAKNVWQKFNCVNMGDYHDLYLKTDVLQLADVWECFTNTCFTNYMLDPAHYVSAPHLTWDAMLKFSKVNIGLLSDPEMFRIYNNNIRGGICYISNRHARANHPVLPGYDPNLPIKRIVDIDENNLYAAAMLFSMPIGEYQWLTTEEFAQIDWCAQSDDQEYGYSVECDLDYPPELHDAHNDYPLAPERIQVNYSCISEQQVEIARSYGITRSCTTTKLMPNLMNKRYYFCDYLLLKFYIEHGLILKKVHRVVRFKQSKWLKEYIELNTKLRKESKQEHEKDLFKLLNNAIYGKTCENLTKRSDIRLVVTKQQKDFFTKKPHFLSARIFGENLAAIQMEKLFTKIDKPTNVGFKVLEVSKLVMMRFYYDQLKVWYGDRVHLLFTDTDSFMLEIETDDWEADMAAHREHFDLSVLPLGHPLRDTTNEKVLPLFLTFLNLNLVTKT